MILEMILLSAFGSKKGKKDAKDKKADKRKKEDAKKEANSKRGGGR